LGGMVVGLGIEVKDTDQHMRTRRHTHTRQVQSDNEGKKHTKRCFLKSQDVDEEDVRRTRVELGPRNAKTEKRREGKKRHFFREEGLGMMVEKEPSLFFPEGGAKLRTWEKEGSKHRKQPSMRPPPCPAGQQAYRAQVFGKISRSEFPARISCTGEVPCPLLPNYHRDDSRRRTTRSDCPASSMAHSIADYQLSLA
jgi:hypothetical protein